MKRKIVVGYDPQHKGGDALALAGLLASLLASKPLVATVSQWPDHLLGVEDLQRQIDHEMRDAFAVVRDELKDLEPDTIALARSSPAQALHDLAETEKAQLLVLGSCHRGAVGRTLLGSVGESLLHGAPCAIAVAPHGYAERAEKRLRRIGVAFDGSPEAWAALETAIGMAERLHARLTVLTVADFAHYELATASPVSSADRLHDFEREEKQRILDLALARAPDALSTEGRLLAGEAGSLLLEASVGFELMVVGSRGYGPLRRTLLGSSTRKLLRASSCPVLVLARAAGVDPLGLRPAPARGAQTPPRAVSGA